jgi:probable phosphoglycerate mutase
MKLIIVRHGETHSNRSKRFEAAGNASGWRLTEDGEKQAHLLAAHLSKLFSVACIYSSPTTRTLETATILKERLESPIVVIDELKEIDCGKWGDKPIDIVKKENARLWRMRKEQPVEFRFPGGETLLDLERRIVPFVDGLLKTAKPKTIILVSHSAMISVILAYLHNWDLETAWRDRRSYHKNSAFTVLEFAMDGAKVVSSNIASTSHLTEDG